MNGERSIIEKLSKLRENISMYSGVVDLSTSEQREMVNLTSVYEFMIEKGFEDLPDTTTEKRCLIDIYNQLKELGLNLPEPKIIETPKFPGEFLE